MFTLTLSSYSCSVGAQEKTNCTSILWSTDSCQNRVSADQHHLTVPRAQVSTHRGGVFWEVIRWQITSFKWSQVQVYFFQWYLFIYFSIQVCLWDIFVLNHLAPPSKGVWCERLLGMWIFLLFFGLEFTLLLLDCFTICIETEASLLALAKSIYYFIYLLYCVKGLNPGVILKVGWVWSSGWT